MKPITDKKGLVAALWDAADIEHQLMVQYLYAGFSLKRDPDDTCTPPEYEHVRRWSSTLFMIARQEMEHLSFVSEMLTAIGEPPRFVRQNIGKRGLQSPYFTSATLALEAAPNDPQPISLHYDFDRFDRRTVERFVCGESPPYKDLPPHVDPKWCFTCGDSTGPADAPLMETALKPRKGAKQEVAAGNVQELYDAIKVAFQTLPDIFVPDPAEVEVPVEYNVFVFPVTDRASAVAAVDLILKQGEGLGDPWNLDSHFRRFMEIHAELVELEERAEKAGRTFDPAYPVISNPDRDDIANDFTRAVFDVANESYVVLLLMLASLYDRAVPASRDVYPHLATALSQMSFAPAMTMVVRALNEVLVRLPIDDAGRATGSNYHIGRDDRELLKNPRNEKLGNITFLLRRWQKLTEGIHDLAEKAPAEPAWIRGSLEYAYQSSYRIEANLRHIYQAGAYPKFVVT
ncbi:MAG TPA: ferritin-like domain-containing protein [Actinomycetota bacterium]|nr:ferritin-like domain-containing protein [Actinomycetota bacterium]